MNSVYLTSLIMTSSGYGEYQTQTYFGKIFSVFAAWLGNILFALSIASLSQYFTFTTFESKAYNDIKSGHVQKRKIDLAVVLI